MLSGRKKPLDRACSRRQSSRPVVVGRDRRRPASAAPAPVVPLTNDMLSADALPTVQIDGVVWSQAVVGNTVYAGGRFNNARPAGAAAGTQPDAAGQPARVRHHDRQPDHVVRAEPQRPGAGRRRRRRTGRASTSSVTSRRRTACARRRVAAYSTATGALITSFNPVGVELAGASGRRHQRHRVRRRRLPGHGPGRRAGTWPPSAPRTVRCSTGTPTPTTRCGRSPSPPTARRSSPAARSRTSAASRRTASPRSTPPPVRSIPSWDPIVNNAGADAGITSLQGVRATSSTARPGTSARAATSKGRSRRRSTRTRRR